MQSSEIRQKFLEFFASKDHIIIPSSSLVPDNDPTLLFTNSGMVQFKNVFTGQEKRLYKRAASLQRVIRVGGKHNDLENVGYTSRHHTFFEMLGNFSFGDYFKYETIFYAWELLTNIYKIPSERLLITVYQEDDESYKIWNRDIGIPSNRIVCIGDNKGKRYASDNFWQMAEHGPCGPCSEIFYDYSPNISSDLFSSSLKLDNKRYIEIWNLVFMEFYRDKSGNMSRLPNLCIDTGMGLERIATLLQNVCSNYDTDLLKPLIFASARETNTNDLTHNSLKVIADHIRSSSFLIMDNVIPSNEGRGYILRRIIRRAIRHGYKLGQKKLFFHKIVPDLILVMKDSYPKLSIQEDYIVQILKKEEEKFGKTFHYGMKILENALIKLSSGDKLDGKTIFTLHDTYGFPSDLTADICREHNIHVDMDNFETSMANQRYLARLSSKFEKADTFNYSGDKTLFEGYEKLESINVTVKALYLLEGDSVDHINIGQKAVIVLDITPFYAESGGQIGDIGFLKDKNTRVKIIDTKKIQSGVFGHYGILEMGNLFIGKVLIAQVNETQRFRIRRNHSATHLMHKALYQILGSHVKQYGSLINSEKIRFDFIQDKPMTSEQIFQVETIVNNEILSNQPTKVRIMSFDEAIREGSKALFNEKYGDIVRVLDIGFSRELCSGTHVSRTGEIGLFKITSENGIGTGIRRIEAVTGDNTLLWVSNQNSILLKVADALHSIPSNIPDRFMQFQKRNKLMKNNINQLRKELSDITCNNLINNQIKIIRGIQVLITSIPRYDFETLYFLIDKLKSRLKSAIILLITKKSSDNQINFISGVTTNLISYVTAKDLVSFITTKINGKGGGHSERAMGSGSTIISNSETILNIYNWIDLKLSQYSNEKNFKKFSL